MSHQLFRGPNHGGTAKAVAIRPSALRGSALQRLAVVAVPIAVLWGFVVFALDLLA